MQNVEKTIKRLNQELDKQYTNAKDIKEKLNIYMNKNIHYL